MKTRAFWNLTRILRYLRVIPPAWQDNFTEPQYWRYKKKFNMEHR